MSEETSLWFGPFRLDVANESVWQGQETLKLTRKAFAVLRYLVERAGQLVTKEALFTAVWPEVVVGDAALTVCIRELRRVLGDDPKAPQYIETVYGRGYRFIAAVTAAPRGAWSVGREASPLSSVALRSSLDALRFVGREAELGHLQQGLDKAASGQRQMVFITGEPGIGKTTMVEGFLAGAVSSFEFQVSSSPPHSSRTQSSALSPQSLNVQLPNPQSQIPPPWIGRGQCIEHHGAGEPYMPILEALGRVCRAPGGDRLVTVLSQYAPTWLAQLPALLSADELAALRLKVQGATQVRMLREMVEALEALTAERPLVLVLEDLHWSDPSTLDLLAMVARRREPARLLILGTYRPSELLAADHLLRTVIHELLAHQQCQELTLEGLSEVAVAQYLEQRFPVRVFPARLAQVLHQRSEGNSLFLVNLVDDLVTRGLLTDGEGGWMVHGEMEELVQQVPDTSRQLIAAQMARVSPATQQTLAAASIAGTIFSAAAVAAALETPITEVEVQCEAVVQQQLFLQRAGVESWPDGTEAARYGFRHALYQEVWHEQGTLNQRQEWHQRIGLRKEIAYNGRAQEIAAELAVHFEQGRDHHRAIQYLQQAAQNALRYSAYMEAIHHLTKGLELLKTLSDTPERDHQELTLQIALAAPLGAIKGFGAPELEETYNRARELCQQVGKTPQLLPVLVGLGAFYEVRGELRTAHELEEHLLHLAQQVKDSVFLVWAHYMLGDGLFWMGEFVPAQVNVEQSIVLYDTQEHPSPSLPWGVDSQVASYGIAGLALWHLGYPDQAVKRCYEALAHAQKLAHPLSLATAFQFVAVLHQYRREAALTQERAEASFTLSHEHGFPFYLALGTLFGGWALAAQGQEEEGIAQIRQGIATWRATGAEVRVPSFFALLADAYQRTGRALEGLSVLTEALSLMERNGEHFIEAELYRLKGTLTLQQANQKAKIKRQKSKIKPSPQHPTPSTQAEAEAYFHKAIEIARKQQAKSLELRAVMSLSRLWQSQGKPRDAHQMLAEVYGWFTEGFDTKDLQEAKALLGELG